MVESVLLNSIGNLTGDATVWPAFLNNNASVGFLHGSNDGLYI